jgi:rare lipoprotein A (peptidoglycan hydrolase)
VSPSAALGTLVLAGIALLSVSLALGISSIRDDDDSGTRAAGSSAVPAGEWYRAIAAPYAFDRGTRSTACGHSTKRPLLGVAHPVLPCGAKLTIFYGGQQVLTQVVDRGTGSAGRDLELTVPLARRLGLTGVKRVLWRFAAPPQ